MVGNMKNVIVLTQNFNISFLSTVSQSLNTKYETLIISPNAFFDSENKAFNNEFENVCFYVFANFLSDEEMAYIDSRAYSKRIKKLIPYIDSIRKNKNEFLILKIKELIGSSSFNGVLLSNNNDLGIIDKIWTKNGFKKLKGDFFYDNSKKSWKQKLLSLFPFFTVYGVLKRKIFHIPLIPENEFHIYEENGKKYIILGKLSRIDYRLIVKFERNETEYKKYISNKFYKKDEAVYLVPWHEYPKCKIPDLKEYDVRYVQDGYLPSNYSDFTYHFKPRNVSYCVWDKLGSLLFKNQKLPYSMLPFRKKLYLPKPNYPKSVKKILVATSASGDWTAQKNRSDDDFLVQAFIDVAKILPDVEIIYRCHPNWITPDMLGVNSINRVITEFESLNLPNLKVSSNIPIDGTSTHTFSRSSLEQDLKDVDVIFGEHSVSMVDAGFKSIVFCPVNITKRRCFAQSLVDLGFPLCKSSQEIVNFIKNVSTEDFKQKYNKAIENYNAMTNEENI